MRRLSSSYDIEGPSSAKEGREDSSRPVTS